MTVASGCPMERSIAQVQRGREKLRGVSPAQEEFGGEEYAVAIEHVRERLDIYHLLAAWNDYLGWRKANLNTIPPERLAAKEYYLARVSNFIFDSGTRMFVE